MFSHQVLTYQAERMPEQIRLKVGGVTPRQMGVYEEFARNIPGFQPLSDRDTALFLPKPEAPAALPPSLQPSQLVSALSVFVPLVLVFATVALVLLTVENITLVLYTLLAFYYFYLLLLFDNVKLVRDRVEQAQNRSYTRLFQDDRLTWVAIVISNCYILCTCLIKHLLLLFALDVLLLIPGNIPRWAVFLFHIICAYESFAIRMEEEKIARLQEQHNPVMLFVMRISDWFVICKSVIKHLIRMILLYVICLIMGLSNDAKLTLLSFYLLIAWLLLLKQIEEVKKSRLARMNKRSKTEEELADQRSPDQKKTEQELTDKTWAKRNLRRRRQHRKRQGKEARKE